MSEKKTLTQKIRGILKYSFKAGLDHKRTAYDVHVAVSDWAIDVLGEPKKDPVREEVRSEIRKRMEESL